jgi:hypothetical protein
MSDPVFKETEDYEKGFAEYYQKEILPLQKELEKQKIKNWRIVKKKFGLYLFWFCLYASFATAVALFIKKDFFYDMRYDIRAIFVGLLVYGVPFAIIFVLLFKEFFGVLERANKQILDKIAFFYCDKVCKPTRLNVDEFSRIGLIADFNTVKKGVKLSCKNNAVQYSFQDLFLTMERSGGRNKIATLSFHGVGHIYDLGEGCREKIVAFEKKKKCINFKGNDLERIYANNNLDKHFKFYTDSSDKFTKVITKDFSNNLLLFYRFLKRRRGVKKIRFAFANNKFLLLAHTSVFHASRMNVYGNLIFNMVRVRGLKDILGHVYFATKLTTVLPYKEKNNLDKKNNVLQKPW